MLFRTSASMLAFLGDVWACGAAPDHPSEQDCMLAQLRRPAHARRAVWLPQRRMNAFPAEIACYDAAGEHWQPGDFVAHFAGAWAHLRGPRVKRDPYGVLMRKYAEWIE